MIPCSVIFVHYSFSLFNAVLLHRIHIQHTISETVAYELLSVNRGSYIEQTSRNTQPEPDRNSGLRAGDRSRMKVRSENPEHMGDPWGGMNMIKGKMYGEKAEVWCAFNTSVLGIQSQACYFSICSNVKAGLTSRCAFESWSAM